jgi:hypothetical protein
MKPNIPPVLIIFALVCFALVQNTQAVSPAPDGAYPGGNTAEGQNALLSLTTGTYDTAVGLYSLLSLTTGQFCTGVGAGTLLANAADRNTATGAGALLSNSTGSGNTANGVFALFFNTTGLNNTASGADALENNTTGNVDTANGAGALSSNTTGSDNTANGAAALLFNTTGSDDTANGESALSSNTTGSSNTADGEFALSSNTTGSNNTALGINAGNGVITASSVICIGAFGANVSNSCFIGNIRGVTTVNNDAIPVVIDSAGQLGTASSSRRYKTDIKPIDKASESILALKPVSFRYKAHKDTTPQFGLIAEEVADINPNLVIYDSDGKPYTVCYDAVNAMLLNEFLKEHQKVQELEKQVEKLTAGLQRVSDQLEASKPTPQVLANDQ